MITIDNFDEISISEYDIDLIQREDITGGKISIGQIDTIRNFPDAKSIIISGLRQDTFDYFIKTYGKQFRTISFWKNKTVEDLSALSELSDIEFITYFHNNKVSKLWDMSKNTKLAGLSLCDFTRLHSLEGIEKACNLTAFYLYDKVSAIMEFESLKPITKTNIKHFYWGGNKILDNDYKCLADSKIEELDISPMRFTMLELAQLLALFPKTLKGTITTPYCTGSTHDVNGYTEYYFLCKRKRTCIKGKDDERFKKYLDEFDNLLRKCREEQTGICGKTEVII